MLDALSIYDSTLHKKTLDSEQSGEPVTLQKPLARNWCSN